MCMKCGCKRDATRQMRLRSLPPYLCISLQRFVFNMKVSLAGRLASRQTFAQLSLHATACQHNGCMHVLEPCGSRVLAQNTAAVNHMQLPNPAHLCQSSVSPRMRACLAASFHMHARKSCLGLLGCLRMPTLMHVCCKNMSKAICEQAFAFRNEMRSFFVHLCRPCHGRKPQTRSHFPWTSICTAW